MSEAKHTKGPWANLHWGEGGEGCKITAAAMRGPNLLAVVRPPMTINHEDESFACAERDVVECEANARLIAAAPELLETLKWALDEVAYNLCHGREADPFIRRVEAAIRKAEGK